ncbi:MAG: FAD-binding oxidoreductase, partial [Bacteroidales bacterium]|nr:FAD-binding oxidoreductase [Bacteroidales bacterium]
TGQVHSQSYRHGTQCSCGRDHDHSYIEFHADSFVNALGPSGEKFNRQLGIYTGLYPVKHQAFITRRLPWLGINNAPLGMLIDRRNYKGIVSLPFHT